jgi:hypothetical protein
MGMIELSYFLTYPLSISKKCYNVPTLGHFSHNSNSPPMIKILGCPLRRPCICLSFPLARIQFHFFNSPLHPAEKNILSNFQTTAQPGRAIAQAVSRWLPTAATRVWSSGICGGQVALGQVFSEYFGFPCQSSFHQLLHNHPHLSSGAEWSQ